MRYVAFFAARGPDHEKGNAIEHPDALVAALSIAVSLVFPRQQVALKESPDICEVNAVFR